MKEIYRVVGFIKQGAKKDDVQSQYMTAFGPEFNTKDEAVKYLAKVAPPFDMEILLKIEKFYKITKNG